MLRRIYFEWMRMGGSVRCYRVVLMALAIAFSVRMAAAAEVPADVLVKQVSQEVLTIVKKDKDIQSGNQQKIYGLVETKVLPHFDFARMTRLAVGRYWRRADTNQQHQLVDQFRTLLVRTYSSSLSNYQDQKIEYKPLIVVPGDTEVTVRTQVIQRGGPPIPVDYSMEKRPGGWKVYDIVIDGVSLVTNYRASFASEIRQGGISGLIQTLAKKNAALPNGG